MGSSQEYKQKYPERHKAHKKLQQAVKLGYIKKGACIKCGDSLVVGHHTDYSKPLEVIWLCVDHHRLEHLILKLEAKKNG